MTGGGSRSMPVRSGALGLALLLLTGCGEGTTDRLLRELQSTDAAVRQKAAQTVADRKLSDPLLIAALHQSTEDPVAEVRRWSCRALGAIGDSTAIPVLEARTKDKETPVRRAAALSLLTLAPDNGPARQELTEAIRSGDGGVIVLLTTWQPAPAWAVPTLLDLLRDRRPGIRRLAVEALAALGGGQPEVATALRKLEKDPDDRVRESVARALLPAAPR